MAEVYGVKPKKFTKEWWPYFWMYYKWHTIGIVGVILAVVLTVYQCTHRPKYDLTMTYTGHHSFTDEQTKKIAEDLAANISDVNGDGVNNIHFKAYTFIDDVSSAEYDSAVKSKLDIELSTGERSFIFILDQSTLGYMLNNDYYSQTYVPVTDWAQELPPEEDLFMVSGVPYAVCLKDSAYLNENSYKGGEMYVILKRQVKKDNTEAQAFEEAKKVLNALIKE